MRHLPVLSLLAVLSISAASAQPVQQTSKPAAKAAVGQVITTPSGLKYKDTVVGKGAVAHAGQNVQVHYTGWLWVNGQKGAKFDSSLDRGQPFPFQLGARQVIAGWDEGVANMHVGGKRTLVIPPNLAYGPAGHPPQIPQNSTLMFDVELLGVQ